MKCGALAAALLLSARNGVAVPSTKSRPLIPCRSQWIDQRPVSNQTTRRGHTQGRGARELNEFGASQDRLWIVSQGVV